MIPIKLVYFWSNNQVKCQYHEWGVMADPGLLIEYSMRPVLMVPVLGPVPQRAAGAAMTMSQSGASVWMSWAISSCYLTTLKTARTKTQCPVHLISPGHRDKIILPFHLVIRRREQSYFDVIVFNRCRSSPWVRLLPSRTRCDTFKMAHYDNVCGRWQFKVLSIKKVFEGKLI